MPDNINVRMNREFLRDPTASDQLVTGVMKNLIEMSKNGEIALTIRNREGAPFEVITQPDGSVAWGVGGS